MLILLSGCKSVPDKSENTVTEIQGVQFSDIDDYDIDKEREFEIDLSTMSFWEKAKPIETKEYAVMYGNAKAYKAFFPILSVVNLEGDRILGLYNNNGGWCWFEYDATGRRHSINIGGMVFYYYYNAQGDVMGLRNTSGQSVVQYTYDSWGKLLSTSGTMAGFINPYNPFRYRGYFYDEETGFYLTGTRYYDPEIGRFINADGYVSTGQGLLGTNMFAYCENNPVNRADPTGMFWKEIGNAIKKTVERVAKAIVESLQIEIGWGVGIGASASIGSFKASATAYHDNVTVGFKNAQTYTSIKGEAGISAKVGKKTGLGVSTKYEHRYETDLKRDLDGHNTTSMPWEVYACEKTVKDPLQINFPIISPIEGELSQTEGTFFGVSGEAHLGVGGHYCIGWDVNEFLSILEEE